MFKVTIPRLPGMKYSIEIGIKYAGWGRVFRQMFWPS